MFRIIIVVMTLLYPLLWYFRTVGNESLTKIIIPLFVIIVFSTSMFYSNKMSGKNGRLIRLAFLFVAAGDLFINLTPVPWLSVPSFYIVHILLGFYFLSFTSFKKTDLLILLPILFLSGLFIANALPHLSEPTRIAGLFIYLLLLSWMLWRAFCLVSTPNISRLKVIAMITGSALFYITDLLAIGCVVFEDKSMVKFIWAVYPPALILLLWSSVHARQKL